MREIKEPGEMRLFSLKAKSHGKKVGFVPTMGAFHEGHLSLIAAAKKRCEVVVASVFVNPLQFSPSEDFASYPRNLRHDKKLLKSFEIDVLFTPEARAMFPEGFKTFVEVEKLAKKLCGRTRPNHFRGVTTVVTKLFNIVCPDAAFFGEKDYQQQLIVKQLVRDLNLPVTVVALPTVREFDGLALSSRNAYLNPRERKSAAILYKALRLAQSEIGAGERDLNKIMYRLRSLIGSEPSVRLDYLVAADPETLEDAKGVRGRMLLAVAAYVGKTRLIDNLIVEA
ncbi:MAG: pantoate--beta-alanine ligase [Candidatus Margulisiibacteriota bacterium]